MIRKLRSLVGNRILLRRNKNLRLGRHCVVHDSQFEPNVAVGDGGYVVRSQIGLHSYLGLRCIVADSKIGRYCSIASNVSIGSGSHPLARNVSTHPIFHLRRLPEWDLVPRDTFDEFRPTQVGSDVWIGTNAVLRDGVTVGDGAVIGAGSIVTRDLEPYGVYAGVPARLLRFRFDETVVERLLQIKWWDRDFSWIRRHALTFADVDRFLRDTSDL
jgi:acetyltransferase-like isoleucine patch superfamily enzyme